MQEREEGGGGDAVLAYHGVGEDPDGGYFGNVTVEEFRSDVAYLVENADVVPHSEIGEAGDRRRVALTFEDGLRSVYANARPVLREFDVPATVFVNPGFVGDRNRGMLLARHRLSVDGRVMLSDGELRDLVGSPRVSVGNHSWSHERLAAVEDEAVLRTEVVAARETLVERYGAAVDAFSYPYGASSRRAREVVERHHEFSFVLGGTPVRAEGNRHRLPRVLAHECDVTRLWE
jgi:peptidoglycan/xylan/chitin deacetylase (PgdA/CDA1 family)